MHKNIEAGQGFRKPSLHLIAAGSIIVKTDQNTRNSATPMSAFERLSGTIALASFTTVLKAPSAGLK